MLMSFSGQNLWMEFQQFKGPLLSKTSDAGTTPIPHKTCFIVIRFAVVFRQLPCLTETPLRDGITEGQFYQVLLYELDAIRKACALLEPNYQPPVTFVVVQKHHHARLFADNHRDRNAVEESKGSSTEHYDHNHWCN